MKRVILLDCPAQKGEPAEKLIRRFFKKYKKLEIAAEYCDKTQNFKTKSQKRRDKRRKNQYLKQKG